MKQWTVMLIPHDRGSTRSLNLYSFHLWVVVVGFVLLSFASAFLFQRYRVTAQHVDALERANAELEQASLAGQAEDGLGPQELAELERTIGQKYEARDEAIVKELSELYDLEAEIRELQGFKPRVRAAAGYVDRTLEGDGGETSDGKGGPPGDAGEAPDIVGSAAGARPPHMIYGLSRPSADLIALEIGLRKQSLNDLLLAMREHRDRIARRPAIWPTSTPTRHVTSRFGWRKDPFTLKGRHHSGLDIGGKRGSPVIATARGEVIFAGREQYFGNVVRIDHGYGIVTAYAHLDKCLVEKGDHVERYDAIGTLGNTGRSTGPHIHYEVVVNGKPVDPEKYLKE
ncbi:MAG: M23 family metallopeptidase [Candidatus Hydrogenedentes bacterium]|nr:M23 family metallopeptidase [Candidatus Hydrogenedentota bacterium]